MARINKNQDYYYVVHKWQKSTRIIGIANHYNSDKGPEEEAV